MEFKWLNESEIKKIGEQDRDNCAPENGFFLRKY